MKPVWKNDFGKRPPIVDKTGDTNPLSPEQIVIWSRVLSSLSSKLPVEDGKRLLQNCPVGGGGGGGVGRDATDTLVHQKTIRINIGSHNNPNKMVFHAGGLILKQELTSHVCQAI